MSIRYIGCFTSQPNSVQHVQKTLHTIFSQTRPLDIVYWFYPYYSKRFNISYPDIPFDITLYPKLQVIRCEDYGPNTKIVPLLKLQGIQPEDRIIIFDDDTEYHPESVETLCRASESVSFPCGVGYSGHHFRYYPFQHNSRGPIISSITPQFYNRVYIMLCSGMVMYPRWIFPSIDRYLHKLKQSSELWLNDDHIFAHYAYKNAVPLYLISIANGTDSKLKYIDQRGMLAGATTPLCEYKMMLHGDLPPPYFDIILITITVCILLYIKK